MSMWSSGQTGLPGFPYKKTVCINATISARKNDLYDLICCIITVNK